MALATGTLGLLAVGVLAVMVTPNRENAPLSVHPTPAFVDPGTLVPLTSVLLERAAGAFGVSRVESSRATATTVAGTTVAANTVAVTTTVAPVGVAAIIPLATLLESGLAIVTAKSMTGRATGEPVAVRLASGATFEAEVHTTLGHAVVVTIDSLTSSEPGHPVADAVPGSDAVVTVLVSPPVTVRLSELGSTDAPEGTAVIDANGRLIGLCTEDGGGYTSLVPAMADAEPETPVSTAPAASTDIGTDTDTDTSSTTVPISTTTSTSTTTVPTSTSTTIADHGR